MELAQKEAVEVELELELKGTYEVIYLIDATIADAARAGKKLCRRAGINYDPLYVGVCTGHAEKVVVYLIDDGKIPKDLL